MDIKIDDELRLLKGSSFFVDEIEIKPFTIGEIVEIGYGEYLKYLNIFIFEVRDFILELPEEYKEINIFDLLLNSGQKELLEVFLNGIDFFIKPKQMDVNMSNNEIIIDNKKINRNNWDDIRKIIKIQNCVKKNKEEEYNPANEEARKIIERIKALKKEHPQKELITLSSIISGVAYKSNNINILNIWNLTIYQLYDALDRLSLIDNYQFTLSGIYAGTVDSKNINMKDINWIKILNKN